MNKLKYHALSLLFAGMSTHALAADPMQLQLLAIDACDALGITGLTIASDETCLSISGEIEYTFEYSIAGDTGEHRSESEVNWELVFEAATSSDMGTARAVLGLAPQDPSDRSGAVIIDEAYVSFGDTTVLTAGLTDTMMPQVGRQQQILSNLNVRRPGGHSIQIESELSESTEVGVALEDLDGSGALAAYLKYNQSGLEATLGGLIYNVFDILDENAEADWTLYGNSRYRFDHIDLFAAFVANANRTDAVSSIGLQLDDLFLKAAYGFGYEYDTDTLVNRYGAGFEFEFDRYFFDLELLSVDFERLQLEAEFIVSITDTMDIELAIEFFDVLVWSDVEATLTLATELSDGLESDVWVGIDHRSASNETIFGAGFELTYEPVRNLEFTAALEGWSNGDMTLEFEATREF